MEEDKLLTTEQILLLENLTYLLDNPPLISLKKLKEGFDSKEDLIVEYIIEKISPDCLIDDKNYGSYMTGKDWKNMIQAIENDDTGEAVVAFRGTVGYEWGDNFLGGAPTGAKDGVSTEYQDKALKWYRSLGLEDAGYDTITVTGHSKGGNKAKYITLLEKSVDRCLSFDGQGFSDEFIERYESEIEMRQGKITNHNVNYDFVNLLLNDVGRTFFYEGFDYGVGKLAEAHCPNTFFMFDKDGKYKIRPVEERAWEMEALDEFLNGYLRSLSPERKKRTIDFISSQLDEAMETGKFPIADEEWLCFAELIEDIGEYTVLHPEFTDAVTSILDKFDLAVTVEEILERCPNNIKIRIEVAGGIRDIVAYINKSIEGDNGKDLRIAPINCPLERNRVFDINKIKQFGIVGKQLLDTGNMACIEWDKAVEGLQELESLVPTEVRSAVLGKSLAEITGPFARPEYEVLGDIIYNNINRMTQDVIEHDNNGAKALDEITERLAANIAIIKGLEESIQVSYEGI